MSFSFKIRRTVLTLDRHLNSVDFEVRKETSYLFISLDTTSSYFPFPVWSKRTSNVFMKMIRSSFRRILRRLGNRLHFGDTWLVICYTSFRRMAGNFSRTSDRSTTRLMNFSEASEQYIHSNDTSYNLHYSKVRIYYFQKKLIINLIFAIKSTLERTERTVYSGMNMIGSSHCLVMQSFFHSVLHSFLSWACTCYLISEIRNAIFGVFGLLGRFRRISFLHSTDRC